MQDSIHESESSETPDIENSQGVAENTTETEVESTVTQTPARFKRLKKADEDTLLKKAISCMEKAISIPPSKEKGTQDADEIFAKFLESELRSIHDPRWKEWLVQVANAIHPTSSAHGRIVQCTKPDTHTNP